MFIHIQLTTVIFNTYIHTCICVCIHIQDSELVELKSEVEKFKSIVMQLEERLRELNGTGTSQKMGTSQSRNSKMFGLATKVVVNEDGKRNTEIGVTYLCLYVCIHQYLHLYMYTHIHIRFSSSK